ncbi:MAG: hypothetical protein U1C51_02435 [Candidatus Izemoplasmatales bacterium]|nr:hypothetical protein [bacterium]MDZ4196088.1 hypothetical protein [Candidatus Izemoplasmatales bacterium]
MQLTIGKIKSLIKGVLLVLFFGIHLILAFFQFSFQPVFSIEYVFVFFTFSSILLIL